MLSGARHSIRSSEQGALGHFLGPPDSKQSTVIDEAKDR